MTSSSNMSDSAKTPRENVDQAIAWHVRLTSGQETGDDWREFTLWLEASPQNRIAYDHVESVSSEAGEAITGGAVAEKSIPFAPTASRRFLQSRYLWLSVGAAMAAGLALFMLLPLQKQRPTEAEYNTQVGQTRSVRLADGSQADLNTATTIRVRIGGGERKVIVLHGEVLFHVARDAAHPFDVLLGRQMVRVLGTVFDVVRVSDKIAVTVAEGHVRFSERDGSLPTVLAAGDQLVYRPGVGTHLRHVPPLAASAWRNGYLIYTNTSLADVVQDLNRYFTRKIVIADATAAHQRFSGVLRIDSEDAMLNRLSRLLPVQAEYRPDGVALLRTARRRE